MRRPAIHLLALATIGLGLAAPAAATASASGHDAPLGPMASMVPRTGITSGETATRTLFQPHELVLASDAPRGLPAVMDAQRTLLERAWEGRVVDLEGLPDQAEPMETEADPDTRLRVPLPSSDVNGDAREDALFFDLGLDENGFRIEAGITALDGSSGDRLWTNMYGNPYNIIVLSPRDVTGDGKDDLFVIVMESERQENGPAGNGPGRSTTPCTPTSGAWPWCRGPMARTDGNGPSTDRSGTRACSSARGPA